MTDRVEHRRALQAERHAELEARVQTPARAAPR